MPGTGGVPCAVIIIRKKKEILNALVPLMERVADIAENNETIETSKVEEATENLDRAMNAIDGALTLLAPA